MSPGVDCRYFSGDIAADRSGGTEDAAVTTSRAGAKAARMAHLEAQQGSCPNDPEPWMLQALEHIDFNPQELTKGDVWLSGRSVSRCWNIAK